MQPVFSSYRSSRALLGIFLFFSLAAFHSQKTVSLPLLKIATSFYFFLFSFFSLLAPFSWLAEKHRDNA